MDNEALVILARNLASAKLRENTAKADRIAIEEKIADLIPGPERGQKTVTLPDDSKIIVERGLNYKADCAAIEMIGRNLVKPPPIKTKTVRELDEKGYEWYRENDPETFNAIAQYVTVTPKKIAVTLKPAK